MSKQDDTDPLPYTQIDRAAAPKVAGLAGLINTTTQHAKGSLIDWWEMHSEPRQLEALARKGVTEIVLTKDECARTIRIATGGKAVDPDDLVSLGLAEKKGKDAYRVRGMSRAFAPILRRIHLREIAAKGGQKSAETRTERYGSPSPHASASASGDASGPASGDASGSGQAGSKRSRTLSGSDQRSTINDTDLFGETVSATPAASADREPNDHVELYRIFQRLRRERLAEIGAEPTDEDLNLGRVAATVSKWPKWFRAQEPEADSDRITDLLFALLAAYLADDWGAGANPVKYPFAAFAKDDYWQRLAKKVREAPPF